jgi:hypothetical protein
MRVAAPSLQVENGDAGESMPLNDSGSVKGAGRCKFWQGGEQDVFGLVGPAA